MALSAIQALYDDADDDQDQSETNDEDIGERVGVITDPSFSVMSKIKLNLTPAVIARVGRAFCFEFISSLSHRKPFSILA